MLERHHRELMPQPKLEGEPLPSRTVTPTFYKNENFCPHRSAYKNCISNYSTYEKLPKINLV
jgi:hypothetical protein